MIGMQSDLLGAHAMGIRNLLVVTGDPPRVGDYPDATAVFEVDSIGLTNLVAQLNRGQDIGRQAIGEATRFLIGVAANPGAFDLDQEIRRFEYKVEAGAEFAITQPVFDVTALRVFLDRIGKVRIPLLAAITPLESLRHAEFMANEVPGVNVPSEILERMRVAEDDGRAREEGMAIARELVAELAGRVQGLQITVPAGAFETAVRVLDAIPV
jgi:homocysteine S-methyltransferase